MDPLGLRRLASILPLATMTMLGSAAAEEATSVRARQQITVDADGADWKDVPAFALPSSQSMPTPTYGREPARNDTDCSATFMSQWSDEYLYFLVVVRDDMRNVDPQRLPSRNDSVEIYLDGRHEGAATYDGNDFQIFIDIDNQLDMTSGGSADDALISHAAKQVTGGYVVELAVPWSMLEAAPRAGLRIGFDLAVNDNDKGENVRDSQLMWSGNGMEYTDPREFGTLVLQSHAGSGESSIYACGSGGASALAVLFVLGLLWLRSPPAGRAWGRAAAPRRFGP